LYGALFIRKAKRRKLDTRFVEKLRKEFVVLQTHDLDRDDHAFKHDDERVSEHRDDDTARRADHVGEHRNDEREHRVCKRKGADAQKAHRIRKIGRNHFDEFDDARNDERTDTVFGDGTLSVDETRLTVDRLRQRFPNLIDPPSDDICYATQNRQGAVKAIAPKVDVMVVVGSANSSNSVRLVDVALESGVPSAHRIDKAEELRGEWFAGATTVGLTSGASVPEILVRDVIEWLQAHGFPTVEVVRTETESTTFALPRDLRADLKAAGMAPARPHAPRVAGPNHTK